MYETYRNSNVPMEIRTGDPCVSEESRRPIVAAILSIRGMIGRLLTDNVFNLPHSQLFRCSYDHAKIASISNLLV
jgi:hypothetical protein